MPVLREFLKALGGDVHGVGADADVGETECAGAVGNGVSLLAGGRIGERDGRVGNHGAAGIGDGAGDGCIVLRACCRRGKDE